MTAPPDQKPYLEPDQKRYLAVVCLFAFALRVLVIFIGHTYRVVVDDTQFFGFGWEMGRVAASVAEGHGFSSPLPLPTGATAMVGPVYPLLLAGVFKTFGVYSTSSAIAIRIIQSVFSSVTCILLYLCGRDTFGEGTGKLAAIAWAVFPLNIFFTAMKVWETSLTSMLAVLLFWSMLSLRDSLSVKRWVAIGALLGITALTSASLVVFVLPFALWAFWKHRWSVLAPAAAGALTCLAVVSPWVIRNYVDFGKIMLRDNLPLEFRIGNNMGSFGQKNEALHPSNNPSLNEHWQKIGELKFMAEEQNANAQFMAAHRGRFIFATLNRIVNYWTGAWIRTIQGFPNSWPVIAGTSLLSLLALFGMVRMFLEGNSSAPMYAGCLFLYPLAYYTTTTQPRFYHAVAPLLTAMAAFWILGCKERIGARSSARAAIQARPAEADQLWAPLKE